MTSITSTSSSKRSVRLESLPPLPPAKVLKGFNYSPIDTSSAPSLLSAIPVPQMVASSSTAQSLTQDRVTPSSSSDKRQASTAIEELTSEIEQLSLLGLPKKQRTLQSSSSPAQGPFKNPLATPAHPPKEQTPVPRTHHPLAIETAHRALAHYKTQKYIDAIGNAQCAERLFKGHAPAWMIEIIAHSYYRIEQYEWASLYYMRAIQAHESQNQQVSPLLYAYTARPYLNVQDFASAHQCLSYSIERYSQTKTDIPAWILAKYTLTHFKIGENERAIEIYSQALSAYTREQRVAPPDLLVIAAQAHLNLNHAEHAASIAENALSAYTHLKLPVPKHVFLITLNAHLKLGNHTRALEISTLSINQLGED